MADKRFRALVIEDDPDAADFVRIALERFAGMEVVVAGDAAEALRALLENPDLDVVVSDIELPGLSGLDMLPQARELAPGVPVIVLTAHGSLANAVEALRKDVDDFLVKPVPAARLAERATELAVDGRARRSAAARQTVLAVGAHPDDVEIGVGATLAAHAAAGDTVVILTLSRGAVGGVKDVRHREALAAAEVIGARLVHLDFEDTHLDPSGGVITAIEEVVADVAPSRVYTHGANDRHHDHRAVHESVQVAARPVPNLWCFQSPSTTVEFRPSHFVGVDGFVDAKLTMLAAYASQGHRDYMEPDLVRATMRYWGRFGGGTYVEPFETVRSSEPLSAAAPELHETEEPGVETTPWPSAAG